MITSVLIPTRGRVDLLNKVIFNLYEKSSDSDQWEICIKVDDDDGDTIQYLEDHHTENDWIRWIITPKGNGYPDMHHWINDLCKMSKGKIFFLYNDDCIMETQDWDLEFERVQNKLAVFKTQTNDKYRASNLFPAIPKKMFDLWGHFSLNAHNDTWVENISREGGFETTLDIDITHDRADLTGNNNDLIFQKRTIAYRTTQKEFYSPEMVKLRKKDKEIIMNYIKENSDEITY